MAGGGGGGGAGDRTRRPRRRPLENSMKKPRGSRAHATPRPRFSFFVSLGTFHVFFCVFFSLKKWNFNVVSLNLVGNGSVFFLASVQLGNSGFLQMVPSPFGTSIDISKWKNKMSFESGVIGAASRTAGAVCFFFRVSKSILVSPFFSFFYGVSSKERRRPFLRPCYGSFYRLCNGL